MFRNRSEMMLKNNELTRNWETIRNDAAALAGRIIGEKNIPDNAPRWSALWTDAGILAHRIIETEAETRQAEADRLTLENGLQDPHWFIDLIRSHERYLRFARAYSLARQKTSPQLVLLAADLLAWKSS